MIHEMKVNDFVELCHKRILVQNKEIILVLTSYIKEASDSVFVLFLNLKCFSSVHLHWLQ